MDFLGRIRKLDNSLQRGLDNGLARVFGGKVVPNELEECLKQEIDDFLMQDADGQYMAPNDFRIGVSPADFKNLSETEPKLPTQLADRMTRYCRNNGWKTAGAVTIHLQVVENLHTGQLKTASHFTESGLEPSGYVGSVQAGADTGSGGAHDSSDNVSGDGNGNHSDDGRHGVTDTNQGWPAAPEPDHAATSADYHPQPSTGAHSATATGAGAGAGAGAAGAGTNASSAAAAGAGALASGSLAAGAADGASGASKSASGSRAAENGDSHFNEWDSEPFPTASRPSATPPAAAPVEQSAPSVTLLLQDGSNRVFEVRPGSNIVGRGTASDFRLPDTGVSRQHAEIVWDGSDAVLVDLHSTNGTIVNGEPIDNWLLADGDIISMGHSVMEVRIR